jgi:threonine dehydratase
MNSENFKLVNIYDAANRLYSIARKTPLYKSIDLSAKIDTDIYYKLELLQNTGSFKVRGASNFALNLSDDEKEKGLVTYSTGNHGRAVSHVAKKLGTDAKVCLSKNVPENKKEGIRKSGGNVIVYGESQDEAKIKAEELNNSEGRSIVPPFDDTHIISGQGTIGLEIMQEIPDLDSVIVPLSGGGLISGVALAVKSINPDCKIYGISMDRGAAMYESIKAGKEVEVDEVDTLADSLQGGISLNNRYTYEIVQKYVDEIVLVTEREIREAMAYIFYHDHFVVEGAAAVGTAALLANKTDNSDVKVAVILTGTNISNEEFLSVIKDN